MNRIVNILVYSTIFISSIILTRNPAEIYVTYLVYLVILPILMIKFGFIKLPFILFAPLFLTGIVSIQFGLNTSAQFIKIFLGYFSAVLFYAYIMRMYSFDVRRMFQIYLKGAYYVSALGLIQVISFMVGFSPGYNFRWILNKWGVQHQDAFPGIRMNSIFSEPAYFAAIIAPAFFVAFYNLIKRENVFITRPQSVLIFFTYFLSFSSLGFMAVFIAILLLLINFGFWKYALLVLPVSFLAYQIAYMNVGEFRDRVDGTIEIFSGGDISSYEIHGSSFVLFNNFHIATTNFKSHVLFGTGLGSHSTAFDKYSLTKLDGAVQIENNKADANSMLLRLMSETGLYGTLFMIIFLFRNFVSAKKAIDKEDWIISSALLLVILTFLIRQGHYFINGFPFFLWLYYYNWKSVRDRTPEIKKKFRSSLLIGKKTR